MFTSPLVPAALLISAFALLPGQDPDEAELVARARAIHDSVITLDTHKDISSDLASEDIPDDPDEKQRFIERNDPTVRGPNQVDFPKMREGGLDTAFYIVYVGQGSLDAEGFERAHATALQKFEAIHRMCRRYPEHIELARTPDDVRRIHAAGKLVCAIGIENGYAMGDDPALVKKFHELGARYMSITHNRHSQLGDSNTPADAPLHGGLTDLGQRAIEEMNLHGIMVDISHSAKTTALQTIAHSKAPVLASHSAVVAKCDHTRNLDDETLKALAKNGGVIQIVAFDPYVKDNSKQREEVAALREELGMPPFRRGQPRDTSPEAVEKQRVFQERAAEIAERHPPANVEDMADHIDHAVKLIGIEHVAISSDFDGGGGVVGWNDASETFNVTLELVRRGYSKEQIEMLWSGNTLRVWTAVERIAKELQAK